MEVLDKLPRLPCHDRCLNKPSCNYSPDVCLADTWQGGVAIPRAWKRREPEPGMCGGGGRRARAGGGRGTESSPPAPPARSRSEIPESGVRPKCRQRAAEQAAKSSAGSRFVRLGLGRLRPAAFPRLLVQCQKPELCGHRRLPGGSSADPEAEGGGGPPAPSRVTQHDEAGGGRVWAAQSIRGARVGSQRWPGPELAARRERRQATEVTA